MQLRQRYAANEDPRGPVPNRGAKRPRSKSSRSVVTADTPAPSGRSPRPPPNYVRYEKAALNITYIATGVTSPRNLRSGVNHQPGAMTPNVKSRSCRKHQQQQQRKPKSKGAVSSKGVAGTSRRDQTRQIGKFKYKVHLIRIQPSINKSMSPS